ncbi:UNVERIFIED_CONTAM: hypothetical protein Slati_0404700 [Sesamum latifolium]|uniref:RNase H type-1 domain-containing protein n=1 Tax=Sesamum latifolium TaxID=2727402 RepID=A0AAW2XVX6_9LAMI
MTEMTIKEASQDQKWLLHVDGSSTAQGSGADIVITTPQGEDLEFAIKFDFKASNNEAEYEALVIGLRMAHETGAKHLLAYSDSQLVVKQVEGTYEAKEERCNLISKQVRKVPEAFLPHTSASRTSLPCYPLPFRQWGIDIVGPFPLACGQRKFLLVAVDYFTKWVEAEPLARITEGEVERYRNGVKACASSKDSPQWLILRPMGKLRSQIASWTTPRWSTGEIPFSLVYGTEAIIPAELGMPSYRTPEANRQARSYLGRIIQGHKRNRQRGLRSWKTQRVAPCLDHGTCTISRNTLRNKIPLKDHQVTGAAPLLRSSEGPSIYRGHPPTQVL